MSTLLDFQDYSWYDRMISILNILFLHKTLNLTLLLCILQIKRLQNINKIVFKITTLKLTYILKVSLIIPESCLFTKHGVRKISVT